ncbi:MAG: TolC family protein [Alphaproteobacteria bacterium]|nr:TolC family protein [Alphaproteobacteria bacterium]
MNKKFFLLFSVLFLVLANKAVCDTLPEVLDKTMENNKKIEVQKYSVDLAAEKVEQSKSGYKPTIVGNYAYGYRKFKQTYDPHKYNLSSRPVNYSVNLEQPIFSGLGTTYNVKAAKKVYIAEKFALKGTIQEVLLDAVEAFSDVVEKQEIVKIYDDYIERLSTQAEDIQRRVKLGEISQTEYLQNYKNLIDAKLLRGSAWYELEVSKTEFEKIAGYIPNEFVATEPDDSVLPKTVEEALKIAKLENPMLVSAREHVYSANSALKAAKADMYPKIKVEAEYRREIAGSRYEKDDGYDGRENEKDASVMLVAEIPLYKAGNVSSKIRESVIQRDQAKTSAQLIDKDVDAALKGAWQIYFEVKKYLPLIGHKIETLTDILNRIKNEVSLGLRSTKDLLEVGEDLVEAKLDYVIAVATLNNSYYEILALMGRIKTSTIM